MIQGMPVAAIQDFHFIRPLWLLAIPVCAWICWAAGRSEDPFRGWRRLIAPPLLSAMSVNAKSDHTRRAAVLGIAWFLTILSLAGPTWRPEPSPFADDPNPVMLVMKAGESMHLSDLAPSRLERSQLKIADFADARTGHPLGLVAFAGSAHLVLPPTRDTSIVASMAAEVSPEIMPKPGDDLVAGLELAATTLQSQPGSILVVVDTVDPVSTPGLKEFRSNHRIPVHFLAVTRAGTPELKTIQDAASNLDASITVMTPDSEDIRAVLQKTSRVQVIASDAGKGTQWEEAGWWLVPVLGVFALLPFRRQQNVNGVSAT